MPVGVVADRWDREDLTVARDQVPAFARARADLAERLAWGDAALDDIFLLLYQAQPTVVPVEGVDRQYLVAQVLAWLLSQNSAVRRLRYSTVRDLVGSAVAAAELAPRLAQLAQEMETAGEKAGEAEGEEEEGDADELAAAVGTQSFEGLDELEAMVSVVAERQERREREAQVWGLEPGELRRLPAPERLALAAKLDTERVRQVTDLFGRLRVSMFTSAAEIDGAGVEPVDVELGDDLARMVGSELLSLLCSELFFAKVGDGALAQYAMHGPEEVGRGGIVLCVDGSASMADSHQNYTRELWATALKLHLLTVARRERRPMHVIDFGGPGEVHYERFVTEAECAPARILEAGRMWFGGGTDFVGPLRQSMEVLADEDDRQSDVVFVSDGECRVSDRACKAYLRGARLRGVRTWGVQLSKRPGGLRSFCDHIFTVSDLTSGRELGALLNAVQSPTRR